MGDVVYLYEGKRMQKVRAGGPGRYIVLKEFLLCPKEGFLLGQSLPYVSELSTGRLPAGMQQHKAKVLVRQRLQH